MVSFVTARESRMKNPVRIPGVRSRLTVSQKKKKTIIYTRKQRVKIYQLNKGWETNAYVYKNEIDIRLSQRRSKRNRNVKYISMLLIIFRYSKKCRFRNKKMTYDGATICILYIYMVGCVRDESCFYLMIKNTTNCTAAVGRRFLI